MSDLFIGDPSFKYPILISSVPSDPDVFSFVSGTVPASSQFTISWTTRAIRPQLSLWNFLWTIRFGSNDDAHAWPDGASLTSDQATTEVSMYTDVLDSFDGINMRVNKLVIKNPNPSTFAYYQYFKSYTFADSVGTN